MQLSSVVRQGQEVMDGYLPTLGTVGRYGSSPGLPLTGPKVPYLGT